MVSTKKPSHGRVNLWNILSNKGLYNRGTSSQYHRGICSQYHRGTVPLSGAIRTKNRDFLGVCSYLMDILKNSLDCRYITSLAQL